MSGTPESSAPNILNKSYSITAEVEIPQGGAEGMLNTLGGAFGGYGLYLVKGKPVFTYVQLTAERFRWEGPAASRPASTPSCLTSNTTAQVSARAAPVSCRWTARQVDSKKMPYSIPFLVSMDESFDVGVDTRYGVDDNDYQVPFRFTGKLNKLTIKLVPPKMTAEEEDALRRQTQDAKNRGQ